jgi:hypothetical protein
MIILAALASVFFSSWGGARIGAEVHFEQRCGGYLSRAARANTIELAERELARAVDYMERAGLSSGYTSVLWRTPDEDIGFWRANMEAALLDLPTTDPATTPLEKSNVLMKLRESITGTGSGGDYLIVPPNALFFWWGWISGVVALAFLVGAAIRHECSDD